MIITSYLMGGLGNQMFQISKAVSEGIDNNIDVVFKPSSFVPMHGNQPTKYLNNIFRNIKFDNITEKLERVKEPSWSYSQMDLLYYKSIEFYGYFQSGKNFENNKQKIIDLFSPNEQFIEKIKKVYPNMLSENSISIHVRRGDYLSISDILPTIDKTYIDQALNMLNNKGSIFIFSNDKKWVEENLNYENSTIVTGLEDYEELWAMSLCNHNVMSNSSFSWWGSYLNKNKNKKVLCPSVWFGPKGEKNYSDIYEPDWLKIDVRFQFGKLVC